MDIQVSPRQSSFSGDAILSTSYASDAVVRGKSFTMAKNIAVANAATVYVLIDYTAWTPAVDEIGLIYLSPPHFFTTVGPLTVTVYRGTDYAGGTEFIAWNPNTTAEKTQSGTKYTLGPSGSVEGTAVLEYVVGGGSSPGHSQAGQSSGLSFFIRNNKQKTLMKIVNAAGADAVLHFGQTLYEI